MEAQILHCPCCASPVDPKAVVCPGCHSPFLTIVCPKCSSTNVLGHRECHRCGQVLADMIRRIETPFKCPSCPSLLHEIRTADQSFFGCRQCHGLWINQSWFQHLCTNETLQTQAAALLEQLEEGTTAKASDAEDAIKYRPCPFCNRRMNRINFGRKSQVIIDCCREHGTWFDAGELHDVLMFIKSGGLEKAGIDRVKYIRETLQPLPVSMLTGAWNTHVRMMGLERQQTDGISAPGILGMIAFLTGLDEGS